MQSVAHGRAAHQRPAVPGVLGQRVAHFGPDAMWARMVAIVWSAGLCAETSARSNKPVQTAAPMPESSYLWVCNVPDSRAMKDVPLSPDAKSGGAEAWSVDRTA